MEKPEHVGHEKNQQYCAQTDAGASAVTPAAMAIVSATAADNNEDNDQEYQHRENPVFRSLGPRRPYERSSVSANALAGETPADQVFFLAGMAIFDIVIVSPVISPVSLTVCPACSGRDAKL